MILEEIKLKNFKSYKNSTIKFDNGISLILGENGAGKSTILDAIRYALFKKYDGVLDDLTRKTTEENDNVNEILVELTFRQNNIKYVVKRGKKNSTNLSTLMRLNRENEIIEITKKESDITKQIEEIIEVDSDSFLNAIYIRQGEITDLIEKKASERKQLISKLLNLEKLEKSWLNLKDIINEYDKQKERKIGQLTQEDSLLNEKEEIESEITTLKQVIIEDKKNEEKIKNKYDDLKNKLDTLTSNKQQYEHKNTSLNEKNSMLNTFKQQLENNEKELNNLNEIKKENISLKREISSLDKLKELLELKNEYDNKNNEYKNINEQLEKIDQLNITINNTKENYNNYIQKENKLKELTDEYNKLSDEYDKYKSLEIQEDTNHKKRQEITKKMQKTVNYGREILNENFYSLEQMRTAYNKEFEENNNLIKEYEDNINKYQIEINSNQINRTNIEKSLNQLKDTTDKCPICQSEITHDKHEELSKQYHEKIEEYTNNIDSLTSNLNHEEEKKNNCKKRLETIELIEMDKLQLEQQQLDELVEDKNKIKEEIEEYSEVVEKYNKLQEDINQLKNEKDKLEKDKDDYLISVNTKETIGNVNKLNERKSIINDELEKIKHQMKIISQQVSVKDNIKRTIDHLEKRKVIYNKNLGTLENEEKTVEENRNINNNITHITSEIENIKKEILELSYDSEQFQNINSQYTSCEGKLQETRNIIVKNETIVKEKKESLEKIKDELKSFEKIKLEQTYLNDYLNLLENLRKLYSKDGIQKDIRNRIRPRIEIESSKIFNEFNFDYDLIKLDENYDIFIKKADETIPVSMLSGGEQIVVALSLRLAIAKVISDRKTDLLILDEPTVHLDEQRRQDLVEILRQTNISPQMLIVTHDADMMAISENIIEIRKDNGISSYVEK